MWEPRFDPPMPKQVRDYDETFSVWDAVLEHLRRK